MTTAPITDMLAPPPPLAPGSSLFLDFDGTLVNIADRPDKVAIPAELADLLFGMADRLHGRLALVTGRSIAQIDNLFGRTMQALAISGSHGCEFRWQDKLVHPPRPVEELEQAARRFDDFAFGHPGTLVEVKTYGVGLHYREDPTCGPEAKRLAESLATQSGLVVQHGKMVVELRFGGGDKGMAVRNMMECAPMAGGAPVYLGDDQTDEAAFAAVNALGGISVLIGPMRATHAQFHLDSPADVLAWLKELAA